jgi:hypothetical protein
MEDEFFNTPVRDASFAATTDLLTRETNFQTSTPGDGVEVQVTGMFEKVERKKGRHGVL